MKHSDKRLKYMELITCIVGGRYTYRVQLTEMAMSASDSCYRYVYKPIRVGNTLAIGNGYNPVATGKTLIPHTADFPTWLDSRVSDEYMEPKEEKGNQIGPSIVCTHYHWHVKINWMRKASSVSLFLIVDHSIHQRASTVHPGQVL
jgi:hypothetical protein